MVPAPPLPIAENGLYGGIGPHPSYVQVAKPYIFEQEVQNSLVDHAGNEAREATTRLQGVLWIDNVRKALRLPVKTYNTAVVYYHKFRLAHVEADYMNVDAAAAALFTACKIEDTLKKSRDILCAAYNLKVSLAEQLTPDDSVFEESSKRLLGLERLMLESSGFDFRDRNPQEWIIKFTRIGGLPRETVGKMAYRICLDLYRTYAPVKQTSSTLGLACVELAARLQDQSIRLLSSRLCDEVTIHHKWGTTRAEVMETLLDLLELYTHHRNSTLVGPEYDIDRFIAVRITLNKEATASDVPRYTEWFDSASTDALDKTNGNALVNGTKPSPMSPANPLTAPSTVQQSPATADTTTTASPSQVVRRSQTEERKDGTVRYMLDAERSKSEQDTVAAYFVEEWEEYEEIIERPARPAARESVAAALDRDREGSGSGREKGRDNDKDRDRDRSRERDKEEDTEANGRKGGDRRRSKDRHRDRDKEVRRRERGWEDDRPRYRDEERRGGKDRRRDERDRESGHRHHHHHHREREDDRDARRDRDRHRDRERYRR